MWLVSRVGEQEQIFDQMNLHILHICALSPDVSFDLILIKLKVVAHPSDGLEHKASSDNIELK